MSRTLGGRCYCGALQYAVADAFLYASNCHCSNCRRATGAAFKPFAGIERDKLTITQGEDSLLIFGDDAAHDARCKLCGSFLYSVVRDGAFMHVAMVRWLMIQRFAQGATSSWDRKRLGTRSRTTCRSIKGTPSFRDPLIRKVRASALAGAKTPALRLGVHGARLEALNCVGKVAPGFARLAAGDHHSQPSNRDGLGEVHFVGLVIVLGCGGSLGQEVPVSDMRVDTKYARALLEETGETGTVSLAI
jgi:hypothetical protein